MKKITKSDEPDALVAWRAHHPGKRYEALGPLERSAIRASCAVEQFYLCAYCCQSISGQACDTVNEHLLPRHTHHHLSLDYSNIVASCTTQGQCDAAHAHQTFSLTPLMDECESKLKFRISGCLEGTTERARETIRVLNLGDHERNNRSLVEKRKQLSHALMFTNGLDPNAPLEDDELLQALIEDLDEPVEGRLAPFTPVVINILKSWLAS